MMTYPKIPDLRGPGGCFSTWELEHLARVPYWTATQLIRGGRHVRIWATTEGDLHVTGRHEWPKPDLPGLLEHLTPYRADTLAQRGWTLYGIGLGPWADYREEHVLLYAVWKDGEWGHRPQVEAEAFAVGLQAIPQIPPQWFGTGATTLLDIERHVRVLPSFHHHRKSSYSPASAEGVVAHAPRGLRYANGHPVVCQIRT